MLLRSGPYTLRPTTNLPSICQLACGRQLCYVDSAKPTTETHNFADEPGRINPLITGYSIHTGNTYIHIFTKITHAIAHSPLSNHHNYTIFTNIQNKRINLHYLYIHKVTRLYVTTMRTHLLRTPLRVEWQQNKWLSAPNDYLFWLLPGADWPRPTDPFTLYRHRLSMHFIYVWINTVLARSKPCLQSLLVCTSNGRLLNGEVILHHYTLPYLELTVHPRVDRAQNNIGAPYSQTFQSTLDS